MKNGSASLSVQPEGQGRSEAPEIAWCSGILRRGGRDVKPRGSARLDSHTSSESYSMSRPSLCTESETDPNYVQRDTLRHIRVASKKDLKDRIIAAIDDINRDPVVHTWTYKINDVA